MGVLRVVSIVVGILLVVSGIYCVMTPALTFSVLGWVLGFGMLIDGIGEIVAYFGQRSDRRSGWTLAGGIVSLLLGIALVANVGLRFAFDLLIVCIFAFWLVIFGLVRIVRAFEMRRIPFVENHWVVMLIVGIIAVIVGIISFFSPMVAGSAIGMMMGICVIIGGLNLIATGAAVRE